MSKRYWKLSELARRFNASEDKFIYWGCEGILPIYILTAKFRVFMEEERQLVHMSDNNLFPWENIRDFVVAFNEVNELEAEGVEYLELSVSCLKKLEAGGLDTLVTLKPVQHENRLYHYGLQNTSYETPTLGECELIILSSDIDKYIELHKQFNASFSESSVSNEAIVPTEVNAIVMDEVVNEVTVTAIILTAYEKRKIQFDEWMLTLPPEDLNDYLVGYIIEDIFNMVQKFYKSENLWDIALSTFKRDFWQQYTADNPPFKKVGGAPPKSTKSK